MASASWGAHSGFTCVRPLELTVLREYPDTLANAEAWMIQCEGGDDIWVREIYMSIDGTPCVTARSLTRLRDALGCWQGVSCLAIRALVDVLYHHPDIQRRPVWICAHSVQQPVYDDVACT